MTPIIIIAGPTASGKSGLALHLALQLNGVIINADSMQVYRDIPILSAQPSAREQAQIPHILYGFLTPQAHCSAGEWQEEVVKVIKQVHAQQKLPIVVGGTGLYLRALIEGLSPIPEVPENIRAEIRETFHRLGNDKFHALLTQKDPVMASRIKPGDSQRMMRALEIMYTSHRSLAEWQQYPPIAPFPATQYYKILLLPNRETLYEQCNKRFVQMIEQGGIEEVKYLASLSLKPESSILKAVGVRELMAALKGTSTMEEAVKLAQQNTRRYAKRQFTWFRHQFKADNILETATTNTWFPDTFAKIMKIIQK